MRGIVQCSLPENRTTKKRSLQVPNSVPPLEAEGSNSQRVEKKGLPTSAAEVESRSVCYHLGHEKKGKVNGKQDLLRQRRQLCCRLPHGPAHLLPSRKIQIVLNLPVAGHTRKPGHMAGQAAVTIKHI